MRTLLAAFILVTVAGCGGDDSSNSLKPDAATGLDAAEIAGMLDCATEDTGSKVSCEADDTFYGISVYESKKARDSDVRAASAATTVLVGNLWMVDAPSAADLEAAQKIIGGKLVGD